MNDTTNNWKKEFRGTLLPSLIVLFRGKDEALPIAANAIETFIESLLHDTEQSAREEGYKHAAHDRVENIAHFVSQEHIKPFIVQARKEAREEIKEMVEKINVDGGGSGRRLKIQMLAEIEKMGAKYILKGLGPMSKEEYNYYERL